MTRWCGPAGSGSAPRKTVPDLGSRAPLLAVLEDLMSWLASERVRGVVVGGIAVSLLTRPRFTRDANAVIWLRETLWDEFLEAGVAFGFEPRRPDALSFARDARVLLLRHAPSGIDMDISLGSLDFEEEIIDTAVIVDVDGLRIPVPRPENLIVMKSVARRPRDLADIEALVDTHPDLDREEVRLKVREFASMLDSPEILDTVETLLTRLPKNIRARKK